METFDKIKSIMDEVFQENKKYKQTLEQIKEIVKEKFKWCQSNKKDCFFCASICSEYRILNLIDEVENA